MMQSLLRIPALMALGYAGISFLLPGEAQACSFAPLTEHSVDAAEEMADTTAPSAPAVDLMLVRRPASEDPSNSCSGSGTLGLHITAVADDRTDAAQMGYVIELASGELPSNLSIPAGPVRAAEDGTIWMVFSDRNQDIDLTLSVRAMDLGGNLSEPTLVQVLDGGIDSGCSAGSRPGSTAVALAGLALLWSLRRRRSALAA